MPPSTPVLAGRLSIVPSNARVFAGARFSFHTVAAGAVRAASWAVIGAGAVDQVGVYRAPSVAGSRAFVVASDGSSAGAATVSAVAPPVAGSAVTVVSCYDGGSVDVRGPLRAGALTLGDQGSASVGDVAAGVAADERARMAYVAAGDRLAAFDVDDAHVTFSDAVPGARFSEAAMVGDRFVAATDNNALAGQNGVRVFLATAGRRPALIASAPAGETPEGIAVSRDGRTIYVTNVNSNSVMRFSFDGRRLRLTGSARTGHRPFGIALDEIHARLFVADNDTPTVSGAGSRPGLEAFAVPSLRRVGHIATGSTNALPLGVAVDAARDRVFVTNEGDGDVVAYTASGLRGLGAVRTGRTPWLPSLDAASGALYVPNAQDDSIWIVDVRTLDVLVRAEPTCSYPTSIGIFRGATR